MKLDGTELCSACGISGDGGGILVIDAVVGLSIALAVPFFVYYRIILI